MMMMGPTSETCAPGCQRWCIANIMLCFFTGAVGSAADDGLLAKSVATRVRRVDVSISRFQRRRRLTAIGGAAMMGEGGSRNKSYLVGVPPFSSEFGEALIYRRLGSDGGSKRGRHVALLLRALLSSSNPQPAPARL